LETFPVGHGHLVDDHDPQRRDLAPEALRGEGDHLVERHGSAGRGDERDRSPAEFGILDRGHGDGPHGAGCGSAPSGPTSWS
jgi:hypothetical protein